MPCQCQGYNYTFERFNDCGQEFAQPRVLSFDFITSAEIFSNYYNQFLNTENEFTIIWHDYSESEVLYPDNVVSGPSGYFLGQNEYSADVSVIDPFGCIESFEYFFGEKIKCIAPGSMHLQYLLEEFYGYTPVYDLPHGFADVGCYECKTCAHQEYNGKPCPELCNHIEFGPGGPIYDAEYYQVVTNSIEDPQNPCNALKYRCPISNEVIEIEPYSADFAEFVDWEQSFPGPDGTCFYPCGCLYPPGTANEYQTNYLWLQTFKVVPCDVPLDPVENEGCPGCLQSLPDEIIDYPETCLKKVTCLDPPCIAFVEGDVEFCQVPRLDHSCSVFEYCTLTGERYSQEIYNGPCDPNIPYCPRDSYPGGTFQDTTVVIRGMQDSESFYLEVFPNPIVNKLNYSIIDANDSDIKIDLFDSFGNVVFSTFHEAPPKATQYIELARTADGLLFLLAQSSKGTKLYKIVKISN